MPRLVALVTRDSRVRDSVSPGTQKRNALVMRQASHRDHDAAVRCKRRRGSSGSRHVRSAESAAVP